MSLTAPVLLGIDSLNLLDTDGINDMVPAADRENCHAGLLCNVGRH